MSRDEKEDNTTYKVVVDQQGQYSIWPADRENARGLSDAGKSGTKAECAAYVEKAKAEKTPRGGDKKV